VTSSLPAASAPGRAGTPSDTALAFFEALNSGEPATAAALFSVDGCFVTPDGTAVAGAAGLRAIFSQMIELEVRLEVESLGYHQAGDICLVGGRLRCRMGTGNGGTVEPLVRPRLVFRRARPSWKLAIVALWDP
jgi:ketosteroid isomerase-like protein